MSIASEITRLQGVKSDILTAIADKGVTVPAGSALDDCPNLIEDIGGQFGSVVINNRTYPTIVIGNIEIITENLDEEFEGITHQGVDSVTPSCCYYNNGSSEDYGLGGTYGIGLLYNGYAGQYIEANKNDLLPAGWGITPLNVLNAVMGSTGFTSIDAARASSIGNLSWAPTWNGSEKIPFNAKPGGNYNDNGPGFLNFGTGIRFMGSNSRNNFYYNLSNNAYDNPTTDGLSSYSYIRLYRLINP